MIVHLFLLLCILLLSLSLYLSKSMSYSLKKEGMENDYLSLAIESIHSASQDSNMSDDQKIALQDAYRYANYIKNIDPI